MPKIKLNHATVRKLLRRQFADQTNAIAQAIADKVNEGDYDRKVHAYVQPYTTDRAAAGVVIDSELQAREGALTRAAAELGLAVKSKGGK